jgi:hypothetical protein
MKARLQVGICMVAAIAFFGMATPSFADYCVQLNGGSFSGDIGFFRFPGKAPKKAGAIAPLTGRAAGLSPVFGTATVAKDGSFLELGVTFFIDGVEGQFDVEFFPPTAKAGSGSGSYGVYGVSDSVDATIVDCTTEP